MFLLIQLLHPALHAIHAETPHVQAAAMNFTEFQRAFTDKNRNIFEQYDKHLSSHEVGLLSTIGVNQKFAKNQNSFYELVNHACSLPPEQYYRCYTTADFEFQGESYFIVMKFLSKASGDEYQEQFEGDDLLDDTKTKRVLFIGFLSED